MSDLRNSLIRLAHDNPGEIQDALLPVLAKHAARNSFAGDRRQDWEIEDDTLGAIDKFVDTNARGDRHKKDLYRQAMKDLQNVIMRRTPRVVKARVKKFNKKYGRNTLPDIDVMGQDETEALDRIIGDILNSLGRTINRLG